MPPWDFLAPMFVMLALVGAFVWIMTIFLRARQRRRELEALASFQTRLLDKLESGQELTAFMESPGGEKLLSVFRRPPGNGLDRVLTAATAGLVLTTFGVSSLTIQLTLDVGGRGFAVIGILLTGLGLGFLASAWLAYTLARRYGVLYGGVESDPNGRS